MADIIDKLRSVTDLQRETEESSYEQDNELAFEAANEIERLRTKLGNIQQARVLQGKAITDANNEIERLRAALRDREVDAQSRCEKIIRLEKALERIAFGKYHWEADAQEEARAALNSKGETE